MKKLIRFSVYSIVVLLISSISTPRISIAATNYTTTENLNVRSTPSTSKKPIGLIFKGTKLNVTGSNGSWLKINYKNKPGYVSTNYVKKTSNSPILNRKINYEGYGVNGIYIRVTPNGKHLTTWAKNTPVFVVGQTGNWLKIKYNNSFAYTYKSHVKKGKPLPLYKGYGANDVYVRETPNGKHLATWSIGTEFNVYAQNGNWMIISYKNGYAYTYKSHISKTSPFQKMNYLGYGANGVYIRESPNGKHLSTWSKNTPVTVTGQIGNWLQIRYYKTYAYTYKTHIKKGKPSPTYTAYGKFAVDVLDNPDGNKMTTLPEGTSFNVYAQNGDWIVINYENGYAYINKAQLTKTAPSKKVIDEGYTTVNLNVRGTADNKAAILTTLPKGKIVQIVGVTGNWLKIKYNSGFGYVSSAYVVKKSDNVPNPTIPDKEKKIIFQDSLFSLSTAINNQAGRAQTYYDKSKVSFYISKNALRYDNQSKKWMANGTWNVRSGPGTNYPKLTTLYNSNKVEVDYQVNDWFKLKNFYPTTINASYEEIEKYLNPNNFSNDDFQFLKLSSPTSVSSTEINEKILKGKGILEGKADSFIKAAELYHINELYLIAHALLETNKGTSDLATGKLKINPQNEQLSTDGKGISVYNMYGIGAYDGQAEKTGAVYAYAIDKEKGKERWDTPEKAIINGAKWIADGYINAGQDTLYKMRWDPNPTRSTSHQYATDIAWAIKQTKQIKNMYDLLSSYSITFEIPKYK